jgi:hypothetical protein
MKTPKPGQLCTINGAIFRAKKRTNGCKGCALNDFFLCPNIVDRRKDNPELECEVTGIILTRV